MFNLLLRIGTAILRDQMSGSQAFYAVRNGRNPGVYRTWDECRDQVNKYSNAQFKKFRTQEEAYQFMSSQGGRASSSATSTYRHAPAASPSSSYTAASSSYSYQGGSSSYSGRRSGYQARPFPYMRKRSLSPAASVQAASIDIEHQSPKRARYVDTNFNERESTSISGFTYKDGAAVVYTDGCCTDNGFHGASAGIGVYWGPGHERNVSAKLPGRQTNNRAEIHAARQAIESAKEMGLAKISLHTDSQFLINGVTKWIHGWKKNGWKLSTGKPVQNKEDFQSLDSALQGIDVQWVHVRGHVGIPGNEAADGLAREGSRKSLEDRGALRN
ncbi:PREDICTED: ribonuclease H1-like [Branchiostoma belcheri]|uniref:Ribonuclease H1 n=1 Tax=Branchiostoma belcheri TaxID=7741 RepID=A0A6P5AB39_BRABE|nr:PREDICTED: ribonuclease H1-like [Branchiostoma belcheri]